MNKIKSFQHLLLQIHEPENVDFKLQIFEMIEPILNRWKYSDSNNEIKQKQALLLMQIDYSQKIINTVKD